MTSIRLALHLLATFACNMIMASSHPLPVYIQHVENKSYQTISAIVTSGETEKVKTVVTLIKKELPSTRRDIYHSIFSWCLENKKMDFLCAFIQATPSSILNQPMSENASITYNQWLLNGAIALQHLPLITKIIIKTPLSDFSKPDNQGLTASDYAYKTGNKEIIELLQIKNIQALHSMYGKHSFFSALKQIISEYRVASVLLSVGIVLTVAPFLFPLVFFNTLWIGLQGISFGLQYPIILAGCAGLYIIGNMIVKDEINVLLHAAE